MPEMLTFIPAPSPARDLGNGYEAVRRERDVLKAQAERLNRIVDVWVDVVVDLKRRIVVLTEAAARAVLAVEELRSALDPLTSAGYRLHDDPPDDEPGFVRVTNGQVRAAYRAYLATAPCLLCGATDQSQCKGLEREAVADLATLAEAGIAVGRAR